MSNANILNLRQSMILGDELKNLKKKRESMVVGKKKNPWNPFSKNLYQQGNLNAANAKIANIRARLNKSRAAQQAQRNARTAALMPAKPANTRRRRNNRRNTTQRR